MTKFLMHPLIALHLWLILTMLVYSISNYFGVNGSLMGSTYCVISFITYFMCKVEG